MKKSKAKQFIHDTVLGVWLAKMQKKDAVSPEDVSRYLMSIDKSEKDMWRGFGLAIAASIGFVLFGFAWMNYFHAERLDPSLGKVFLFLALCSPFIFLIVKGVRLIAHQVPPPDQAVKRLVDEYLELRSELSKVDLWDSYVVRMFEIGRGMYIPAECITEGEDMPIILQRRAEDALHRFGQKVDQLKRRSRAKSAECKTKTFIPAFRLAKKVGAITGSGGYGQYIPGDSD